MAEEKRTGRGGARPGAGRKTSNPRNVTLCVRITQQVAEIINKSPNKSDYIEAAILFYNENKEG